LPRRLADRGVRFSTESSNTPTRHRVVV